jgi:molybdopterin-guanine dinucleotide biosynthesis protein B
MPLLLNVIGCKHAGKTRLIELLVPLLKQAGIKVGTVKYAEWNHFQWERPGTETSRHIHAGSDVAAIFGRSAAAVHYADTNPERCDLERVIKAFFNEVDIVIIEGLCAVGAKLEVWREGYSDRAIASSNEHFATYGDCLFPGTAPHFHLGSEHDLSRLILDQLPG